MSGLVMNITEGVKLERDYAGELVASELELREYARNSFLRDNHIKYRKYCDEWIAGVGNSSTKF